jgi:hypothetical protein
MLTLPFYFKKINNGIIELRCLECYNGLFYESSVSDEEAEIEIKALGLE